MEPSNVSYTLPVSRSFSAVGRVLFKPFDIGKWFVLGFSAWLAALLSGGSSFSGNYSGGGSNDNGELEDVMQVAGQWIQENMNLIIVLAVVGLLRHRRCIAPWTAGLLLAASLSVLHSIYWSNMRMRSPLVPVVSLLASSAVIGKKSFEINDY